ncbi:MAG: hypothetical protein FWB92_07740, partial [Oscillospiraceae bacterium]|nr:hypothetical protein [Oscillospiraceae bacterium]
MGKGMKIIKKFMIGMLAVLVLAGTAVTLLYIYGDNGEAPERTPRVETRATGDGNVFDVVTDPVIWLNSRSVREEGQTWHFFPNLPDAARSGDIINLNVPADGFLAWESDSDIVFTDEPSDSGLVRGSFVVPEGDFSVWALHEFIPQERESIFLINPDIIEHGQAELGREHDDVTFPSCPPGCQIHEHFINVLPGADDRPANTLVLNWGMFGNEYGDVITLHGFPNLPHTNLTVTTHEWIHTRSFYFEGSTSVPQAGPGFHGMTLSPVTGVGDQRQVRIGGTPGPPDFDPEFAVDMGLDDFPQVVTVFNFDIIVNWTDRVMIDDPDWVRPPMQNPLDPDGPQIPDPDIPHPQIPTYPTRTLVQAVQFTVLPLPRLAQGMKVTQVYDEYGVARNVVELPDGMDSAFYGGRPTFDADGNEVFDSNGYRQWITDGHNTNIDLKIPEFPIGWPELATPEHPSLGLSWVLTFQTELIGLGQTGGNTDRRFVAPDTIFDEAPSVNVILESEAVRPPGGSITSVLRLTAFAMHPGLGTGHGRVGSVEFEFTFYIHQRPTFVTATTGLEPVMDATLCYTPTEWTQVLSSPPATPGIIGLTPINPLEPNTIALLGDNGFVVDPDNPTWLDGTRYIRTITAGGFPPNTRWRVTVDDDDLPPGMYFAPKGGTRFTDEASRILAPDSNGQITIVVSGIPRGNGVNRFNVVFDSGVTSTGVSDFIPNNNRNMITSIGGGGANDTPDERFELIVWPRTYLYVSMGSRALDVFVRRQRIAPGEIPVVDEHGRPRPEADVAGDDYFLVDNTPGHSSVNLFVNRRAVMPGTIAIISRRDSGFVRWEHATRMSEGEISVGNNLPNSIVQPNEIAGIGGRVGANGFMSGHTNYTGHWRTHDSDARNFLAVRMPTPPIPPGSTEITAHTDVFITGFALAQEPRIEARLANDQIGQLNPYAPTLLRSGEFGVTYMNDIEIDECDIGQGSAQLGWEQIGEARFADIGLTFRDRGDQLQLRGAPNINRMEPFPFTIGVTLPGTMRIDRDILITLGGPPDT